MSNKIIKAIKITLLAAYLFMLIGGIITVLINIDKVSF